MKTTTLKNLVTSNKQFRDIREQLNLTQKEMAECLGVTENYIYLIESSKKDPSKSMQILIRLVYRYLTEKNYQD